MHSPPPRTWPRRELSGCVLLALLLAAPPAAAGKPRAMVLLPIKGKIIPTLGAELTAAIRAAGKTIEPAQIELDELMLAVGCGQFSVACLQKMGKMIQARSLIIAQASRFRDGAAVRLRWFDVRSGGDRAREDTQLSLDRKVREPQLRRAVGELFGHRSSASGGSTSARPATGELQVSASGRGAVRVWIDDKPRGTAPIKLSGLAPGSYRVTARRAGFEPWSGSARVRAGGTTELHIALVRDPNATTAAPGFWSSIAPHTWVIAGAGLASLGVATGFAIDTAGRQSDFDRLEGNTSDQIEQMQQLRDTGERHALVANIMFGVGGGLTALAAVLAAIDYYRAIPEHPDSEADKSTATSALRAVLRHVQIGRSVGFSTAF